MAKKYPLDKFTTKSLIEEILSEKGGKDFTDPEDFVSYLFDESKVRKLTVSRPAGLTFFFRLFLDRGFNLLF